MERNVTIRVVERALAILDAFDTDHRSLTLQEIGDRISMPKATTHRLVHTLQNAGFLIRLEDQRFCLSLKVFRLAGAVKSTLGVRETARPALLEVSQATGETVTLNMRFGLERICLDVLQTPSALMTIVRPGEHIGLLFGASARVLLAYCSEEEIIEAVRQEKAKSASGTKGKTRMPSPVKLDEKELHRDLARIRKQGFATSSGQRVPGVSSISVPIFDMDDRVEHAISVIGPAVRIDPHMDEIRRIVLDAAARISLAMGATAS
jgi:IclR family transcriptional regulator, KDG regulon repressor